jgi:uncharacterized protein
MEVMRLVITGPVGAGKSTFIRSVSEIEVVDTDRKATDETAALKSRTTVAMDFGRLQFTPDMAIHLYGTPGQSRFDFMWEFLIEQAHAYILLVPADRPAEFRNARLIHRFMRDRTPVPMIVGVTHVDCADAWDIDDIAIAMGFTHPQNKPLFVSLNATDTASVAQVLMALIGQYAQAA